MTEETKKTPGAADEDALMYYAANEPGKAKGEEPTALEAIYRAQRAALDQIDHVERQLAAVRERVMYMCDQLTPGANATVRRMARAALDGVQYLDDGLIGVTRTRDILDTSAEQTRQAAITDNRRTLPLLQQHRREMKEARDAYEADLRAASVTHRLSESALRLRLSAHVDQLTAERAATARACSELRDKLLRARRGATIAVVLALAGSGLTYALLTAGV